MGERGGRMGLDVVSAPSDTGCVAHSQQVPCESPRVSWLGDHFAQDDAIDSRCPAVLQFTGDLALAWRGVAWRGLHLRVVDIPVQWTDFISTTTSSTLLWPL